MIPTKFSASRATWAGQVPFDRSRFDFERWAVSLINAQPNEKQVGDKGIDGIARFPLDTKGGVGRILVSVEGGRTVGPQFARDLLGTVETLRAQMGVLIIMGEPTRGVLDAVAHGGKYVLPVNGHTFPKVGFSDLSVGDASAAGGVARS